MPSSVSLRFAGTALAGAVAAASLAPSADAVLLWKKRQEGPAVALAGNGGAASGPAASAPGLAGEVARALGSPTRVPVPTEAAAYGYQQRALEAPHAALQAADHPADRATAFVHYGNQLARVGNDAAAARAYAEAVTIDPELSAAWNNLGALARRAGENELARQVFEGAVGRDERDGLAWFNLALTFEQMRKFDQADEAYLVALRLEPALWLPQENPLIVGNERAQRAIHRSYLRRGASGSIYLDAAR